MGPDANCYHALAKLFVFEIYLYAKAYLNMNVARKYKRFTVQLRRSL